MENKVIYTVERRFTNKMTVEEFLKKIIESHKNEDYHQRKEAV